MEITKYEITIRKLVDGFEDNAENGVRAYGGKLDIRPPYQREFVYGEKERAKVIETVMKGFPLNTMYWAKCTDGNFEIIDGQQRTMSICQYVNNEFSCNFRTFKSLQEDEKERFLNYRLFIYVCDGGDKEKLDWFETINIAGKVLTPQELRNATFHGSWVSSAKFYFSKTNCAAYNIGNKYLSGEMKRQAYLETAIKWISNAKNDDEIREYMAQHIDDPDAQPLFSYFRNVIEWVQAKFPNYREQMKGVSWGTLFNKYGNRIDLDAKKLEEQVQWLFADPYVQDKKGIYEYVLGGCEQKSLLNIRVFDDSTKQTTYARQTEDAKAAGKSNCPLCAIGDNANKTKIWDLKEMDADHVTAWSKGGATDRANCEMLCKMHNRAKGNR